MDDLAGRLQPAKAPIISRPIWRQTAGQVADGTALEVELEVLETIDEDGGAEEPVGPTEVLLPPGYGGGTSSLEVGTGVSGESTFEDDGSGASV